MRRDTRAVEVTRILCAALALLAGAAGSASADFERTVTLRADRLELCDLIGEVRLEGWDGDAFEATITVRGDDAREDLIAVETREGPRAGLTIRFPTDEERRYVYPALGRGSKSTISASCEGGGDIDLNLWDLLRGRGPGRITVAGSGRGLEVWADVLVRVPAGKETSVCIGVGRILANRVRGDSRLESSSGPVSVESHEGALWIDTGSGGVSIEGCRGEEIRVDTGSGGVELREIDCADLQVDTGSGGVRGRGLSAEGADIDTGSGGIALAFDRMGGGDFRFDTGSGSVTVGLPQEASAEVRAETGSGSVRADVDFARILHRERDELAFTVGDGAASIDIDTGSGSIEIVQR